MTLVNDLPDKYGFDGDDTAYLDYKALKTLQAQLINEGRNVFMLTGDEKDLLETLAANNQGRAGSQARGILSFVYGNEYVDCPEFPGAVPKSGKAIEPHDTGHDLMISAVPNPAKSYTIFKYELPEGVGSGLIEVRNMTGQIVYEIHIESTQGEIIWDTRDILPGVYIYVLKTTDGFKTGKLLKIQ